MKIIIAGGSGFAGRALLEALERRGDEAVVLTRRVRPDLRGAVLWDGRTAGPWREALEGAAAIVNLCGESVAEGRWTGSRKKALYESRILSTRALAAALPELREPPKVLINASAVGYYGDRGEELIDESAGPGTDFLAKLCVDWEKEALAGGLPGTRVVLLRIGVVLGAGGGALPRMLLPFKLGLGGPLGTGRQWMPWIALEDVVSLIFHAVGAPLSGPVNAVSPNPERNRDFAAALGRALHRPAFLPEPALALRLALGEMSGILLGGQHALPRKALESGFKFRYHALPDALRALLP